MHVYRIGDISAATESHLMYLDHKAEGTQLCAADDADLSFANFSRMKLDEAEFCGANLHNAYFTRASLVAADFARTKLFGADFIGADLTDANMKNADLSGADFRDAILGGVDFTDAKIGGANFSGAKGLPNARDFMAKNFDHDSKGWIVYKGFGRTTFTSPYSWKIERGAYIEENVNPDPTVDCACGVNFATPAWIVNEYHGKLRDDEVQMWKCHIDFVDAVDIVVPYDSEGKARCGRLKLLNPVKNWRELRFAWRRKVQASDD